MVIACSEMFRDVVGRPVAITALLLESVCFCADVKLHAPRGYQRSQQGMDRGSAYGHPKDACDMPLRTEHLPGVGVFKIF